MINKNARGSFEERPKVRSEKANINIQINFNMKDKPQGFSGKKIDNYLEIEHKNNPNPNPKPDPNPHPKNTEELKKNKKRTIDTADKNDKDRLLETPNKVKIPDRNRAAKNATHEKTPERKSIERREERSKSTNQKPARRKNAKSVQNIRAVGKNVKKISPSSSAEKSRSHSKSSKKLLRSSDSSLKNIFAFSNSGIKNKIKKGSQGTVSRERIVSKKPLEDQDKIKKFMEDKKRKEKTERLRQIREERTKKERMNEELKKVEAERKANAAKPFPGKKLIYEKEERFPIYFDEDELDDPNEIQNFHKQAEKMIHDSPTPKNTIETIPLSKIRDYEKLQGSSSKKSHKKHHPITLVHRYFNGTITEKQLSQLQHQVVLIQSFWRGFAARKSFAKKLSDESTRIRYIKNRIENKKGIWNDEENSIINLQRDHPKAEQSSPSPSPSSDNYINYNSNPLSNANSIGSQNSVNSKLVSSKGDRYKKLSIQLEEEAAEEMARREKSEADHNAEMMREIEELRRMLEQQNQKYRSLEEENLSLKRNITVRVKEDGLNEEMASSIDFIKIRMPKKIESPRPSNEKRREEAKTLEINNQLSLNISPEADHSSLDLSSYKKQLQAFECSSPSNAVLEEQLRSLKGKNIEGLFRKKEITIQQKYEKKYEMFDKMLSDRLFSPRTYNLKKKDLEVRLSSEILEVQSRKEEAKRVVGFISDLNDDEDEANSLRTASLGVNQETETFNFKKEKEREPVRELKDTFTNTSPIQAKESEFKAVGKHRNKFNLERDSNSSYSSEEDKVYRKYWTDDMEEVHNYTLEKMKKIDEALKEQSEATEKKDSDGSSQYNSQGREEPAEKKETGVIRAADFEVNLATLKESYEDYLQEEIPSENERKAKEIFNKIDLSECKSEEELESSHDNICKLLNAQVFQGPPQLHSQIKQVENLYISEAGFNTKKRKDEQLSRSSSFEKSNKSLSNSQVQVKGFITNLTFIKEFCISVCEYIRNVNSYKEAFVGNISQTIHVDFAEYLKAYRITLGGEVKGNYNTYTDEYLYHYFRVVSAKDQPISHDFFSSFMKAYEEEKAACPEWNKPGDSKDVKEMREYFLISIIDAFNESLEFEKPGGVHGEPFPWMTTPARLRNHAHSRLDVALISHHEDSQEETEEDRKLDQIFGSSIAKIIQWGSFLCGFIADPMPMEMGDSEIANLSEEQLSSIRENRIGLMLEKWLLEEEERVTNASSEYTEVLLNLGEKVIELLILECSEELEDLPSMA